MNLIGEYWGFYGIKAMSFRGVAKVSNDLRDLEVAVHEFFCYFFYVVNFETWNYSVVTKIFGNS